jgi:hypothetical protein
VATYSGTIDLRVTGNAEQKAELIKKRISEIKSIANTLKPVPNLFDKRGNDAIVKAKEELRKLVEQYGKGTGSGNRFSNTIAGLNRQLGGFNRILSNVNIKSDEFAQALAASEKVSRRLARAEAERLKVQTQINTANTVGRATSVQETLDLGKIIPKSVAGLEFYQRELEDTLRTVRIGSQDYQDLARAIADVNRQLQVAQGQGPVQGPALPPGFNERGRIPRPGRRGSRFQDIATGAGFPLLFGGGPFQALAGGIGGAVGGLGGSIAGSAIASQVEAFARAAAETGVALTSTGGALDLVREKALFSSAENEELAAKLEEQGDAAGLSALLTQELADKIGNQGVESLAELGTETQNVTKLWNELTLQLQSLIAGPLSDFLSLIGDLLGEQVAFNRLSRLQQDLAGTEEGKRLDAAVAGLKAPGTVEFGDGKTVEDPFAFTNNFTGEAATELFNQFKKFRPEPASNISVTDKDRRRFSKTGSQGKRSRVPDLNAEIQLQERLLTLNNQIAQAKRDENPAREAALQMEVALEKEAAKIAQIEAKRIPEIEKVLEKQLLQVQTSQELANIQNRLNDVKAQEAEKAQDVLDGLLQEQALLQATLDGRLKEEQIKQRVAEITDKNKTLTKEEVQAILEGIEATKQKITLQEQENQLYAQIGQTIQSGIVGGIQSAIDGSKSLGESLSGILKQVGGIFLQAGIGSFGVGDKKGTGLLGTLFAADGAYVSGPTPAVVGEGGESEYIIPSSKMNEAMGRYARGARGGAVIPDGPGGDASGGMTGGGSSIDVSYSIERINNVNYVTAAQFERGMAQAAKRGAELGRQGVYSDLVNKRSVRSRVGV